MEAEIVALATSGATTLSGGWPPRRGRRCGPASPAGPLMLGGAAAISLGWGAMVLRRRADGARNTA